VRSGAATTPLARSAPLSRLEIDSRSPRLPGGHSSAVHVAASAVELTTRHAVEGHFADSPRAKGTHGIYYVGKVLSEAPLSDAWRDRFPCTVVTWQNGDRADISASELLALDEVVIPAWAAQHSPPRRQPPPTYGHHREARSTAPIVSLSDTPGFAYDRFVKKINVMNLIGAASNQDLWLFHFSATPKNPLYYRAHSESHAWVAPLDLKRVAGLRCDFLGKAESQFYLLDHEHAVIRWLCLLREFSNQYPSTIKRDHVEATWRVASKEWYKLDDLLSEWANDRTLPPELKPPTDQNGGLTRFHCTSLVTRTTLSSE